MKYSCHAVVRLKAIATLLACVASPAAAQLPDSVVARSQAALSDFSRICASASAKLWRESLCGPIVLVDPEGRGAIANERPPSGVFRPHGDAFLGTLPEEVPIANTVVGWSGRPFTMVMLPLSSGDFDRTRLLFHEAFHRVQGAVEISNANIIIAELEERDARYWLRLELRALSAIQLDSGMARARVALGDALLFRARRYALYPGLDSLEAAQELSEGLAEYTGATVAASQYGRTPFEVAEWARRNLEARATFARSYAYGAGPSLGLALDRFSPDWRTRVRSIRSLSDALIKAIRWTPPAALVDSAAERASRYDALAIAAAEDVRAARRTEQLAGFRTRLIDGPVLVLRQRGLGGAFNPNTIVPLPNIGLIYPSRTVVADWGQLAVRSGGLLVANDHRTAWVTARGFNLDAGGTSAVGDGWELRLAKGWTISRGTRDGDFRVVENMPIRPPD